MTCRSCLFLSVIPGKNDLCMEQRLIECIPNFSEGRDTGVIRSIMAAVESVAGVRLLHVDPGKGANRTVFTFVGEPELVVEAAFRAIREASEKIDMRLHHGTHPRIGATDVCPLVPVAGVTMAEAVMYARKLAGRVGEELHIPVYLYEQAAMTPARTNLADIRRGGYEGLRAKMEDPLWKPDYGPAAFHARSGATVIGARDFLVAYNVNLDTPSVTIASEIAMDVREKGRIQLAAGGKLQGKENKPARIPGLLKHVKAIGWYIEEYGRAQVSMNLTNIRETPVHQAYQACVEAAARHGTKVTGSELIGMIPLQSMLEAGVYFLALQHKNADLPERELVKVAIECLGLSDLAPFDPEQKIIEYKMQHPGRLL